MKDIRENLPFMSVCLLAAGAIWLTSYYNYFGVEITDYVDFSEIFQLQFLIFLALGLLFLFSFANAASLKGYLYGEVTFSSKRKFIKVRQRAAANYIFNKYLYDLMFLRMGHSSRKKSKIKIHKPFFGLPLILVIILFLSVLALLQLHSLLEPHTEAIQIARDYIILAIAVLVYVFTAYGIINSIKPGNGRKANFFVQARYGLLCLLSTGYGIIYNRDVAYRVVNGKPNYKMSILLKDRPINYESTLISTSKNIVYIGQTKNYIFLHNCVNMQNHIIPKVQVLDIQTVKLEYDRSGKLQKKL